MKTVNAEEEEEKETIKSTTASTVTENQVNEKVSVIIHVTG